MPSSHPRPPHLDEAPHSAITQAVYRSWWNVDRDLGIGSELLYTEDGVCVMPALTMTGRAEIADGYAARQANGPRLSRHLVSNLVSDIVDDDHITATYVLTLYARNGVAPSTLDSASAICDVVDDFVRRRNGWLIERRVLEPVFVAAENDSVLLGNR